MTGTLAHTITEALRYWQAQKADGVPVSERVKGLERCLRDCWPFTREWKYLCERCGDLGWEYVLCAGDQTCGRDKAHLPHEFVVPCYCEKGRAKLQTPTRAEDYTQAVKTQKPARTFSRFGQ
jgi:hypothetical protein